MWGICFYSKAILENRLFQKVVAFDLDTDNKTAILSQPEHARGLKIPVMELKLLSRPPEFAYAEQVRIVRHPERIGKLQIFSGISKPIAVIIIFQWTEYNIIQDFLQKN